MSYFLFTYDQRSQQIVGEVREIPDSESARALQERFALEKKVEDSEVVLLRASSLDELHRTHRRYFTTDADLPFVRGLSELTKPDRRVGHFTPGGLSGSSLSPAASLLFIQQLVAGSALTPAVPDEIQERFEVIRKLHTYGFFVYQFFTVALIDAQSAHEQVLGRRFLDHYRNQIPLENRKTHEVAIVQPSNYGRLVEDLSHRGRYAFQSGWRLKGHRTFDGSLFALYQWGVSEKVLRPWLDKKWSRLQEGIRFRELTRIDGERALPKEYDKWPSERRERWWNEDFRKRWELDYLKNETALRNILVHATAPLTVMPPDSARAIQELADFTNSLWPISNPRQRAAKPRAERATGAGG